MSIKEAIEVLKLHNQWRRYDGDVKNQPKMVNPKELGTAIDVVAKEFEKRLK